MRELADPKTVLDDYLQRARDALVWKLDGLTEREARLPRTPTGNNLLGIVKHCLNVEVGYFGPTFGRDFPTPADLVPEQAYASSTTRRSATNRRTRTCPTPTTGRPTSPS